MSTADILLGRCDDVRRVKPRKNFAESWRCRCTGHEDRSPSLDVDETVDGRVLIFCRAGCSAYEVVAGAGLQLHDLFPPRLRDFNDSNRPARINVSPAVVLRSLDTAIGRAALLAAVYGQTGVLGEDHRQELLTIAGSIHGLRRTLEAGR